MTRCVHNKSASCLTLTSVNILPCNTAYPPLFADDTVDAAVLVDLDTVALRVSQQDLVKPTPFNLIGFRKPKGLCHA